MAGFVDEIVATYDDMGEDKQNRLRRLAYDHVRVYGISNFAEMYSYVARMADMLSQPYAERFNLSLDHPVKGEGKSLAEVLRIPEEPQQEEPDPDAGVSLDYALASVWPALDDEEKDLVYRIGTVSKDVRISVVPEPAAVGQRLQMILVWERTHYRRIHPEREVRHIHFGRDAVHIKLGLRSFQGDPLGYYFRHNAIYGKMGRTELLDYDSGLYQSLANHGVLSQAIPFRLPYRSAPPAKLSALVFAHREFDRSPLAAARALGLAASSVSTSWQSFGLPGMTPLQRKTYADKLVARRRLVQQAFVEHRTLDATAAALGCDKWEVYRHVRCISC